MNFSYESRLWKRGFEFVGGVDEVGRGPLAGPVVSAAVVFPAGTKISGLDDSKKLTPQKREALFYKIKSKALGIGVAKVSHKIVDKINIWEASLLAMKMAVENLPFLPDYLLVDGERLKIDLPVPQMGISGGDGECASIAAASIIAKVTRDRIMLSYHKKYPEHRFDLNKGYGTKLHLQRLQKFGPSPIHRRSFSPLCQSLQN